MQELPRFRPDMVTSPQVSEGEKFYILKDPLTRKFFRVRQPEYLIIQNLDGKSSLREICARLSSEHNISAAPEAVEKFVQQLESFGFLVGDAKEREAARLVYQAVRPRTLFQKIIFMKLKAFDPNPMLERLSGRVKWIFSRTFAILSAVTVILGIFITITQWGEFSYSLSSLYQLSSVLGIWLTAFWVVSLHEFAHAFTCQRYGGEVREMGFLLLYFQPCFYCNLSDAWLFPEKKKRLWVGFSGAYFQIFIWGAATILWRLSDPEALLNQMAFITMITSGVLVLFNFNPLIRLDGYYLLSDYLEIPNLRQKAFHYSGNWLKRYILRLPVELPAVSPKEKKIFPVYAVLSLGYSVFLLGFVFIKLGEFLISRLQGTGFILYSAILLVIFKSPLQLIGAGLIQFLWFKKESMKNPGKLITYLAALIAIIAILVLVKIDLKISQECEIRALETYTLSNQSESFLEEKVFIEGDQERRGVNYLKTTSSEFGQVSLDPIVKEGQKVQAGELVARLVSNQYLNDLKSIEARIASAQATYDLLKKGPRKEEIQNAKDKVEQLRTLLSTKEQEKTRMQKLWDQKLISQEEWDRFETGYKVLKSDLTISENQLAILLSSPRREELDQAEAEIEQLEAQAAHYRQQIESSLIKTPITGVVTKVRPSGDMLSIIRYDSVLVMIPVSEKDMDVVQKSQKIKLKVKSYPGKTFAGEITKVSQQGESKGNHNIFWITAKTPNSDLLLKPGMTGQAKIYCGKKPILSVIARRIVRWFKVEVWSWF